MVRRYASYSHNSAWLKLSVVCSAACKEFGWWMVGSMVSHLCMVSEPHHVVYMYIFIYMSLT